MEIELPVTRESLEPPDFKISADKPKEMMGGLDEHNWQWAVVERLDYIAKALHILVGG